MYRLIWFQHIHKAAGSMIVNQAIANGEKLFSDHRNGNPITEKGELIPLWDFTDSEISSFIDKCQTSGVTFIATEWGSPNFDFIRNDPRVVMVTCIRNPWKRVVSNFYFEYYLGRNNCSKFDEFLQIDYGINMDNMLVRVFSNSIGMGKEQINYERLETAKENIQQFDLVLVLERENDIKTELFASLGWMKMEVNSHPTFGSVRTFAVLLYRLKFLKALRYLLGRHPLISKQDEQVFGEISKLDFEFYDYVIQNEIIGKLRHKNR